MKKQLVQLARKTATAGTIAGVVYYFGLLALIAGSTPSAGNGPTAWDGYMPATPGARWFMHLGIATALIFSANMLRAWADKNETN